MQIDKVNVYPITLPFSALFSHSLRKRSFVSNVIVEVIADHGKIKGYGEGAPRSYVTGETQTQAKEAISSFVCKANFPWHMDDVDKIWEFSDGLPDGRNHNAAICAIETALLDAFGKSQECNILKFFPKDFYTDRIYYGTAIPLDRKQRVMEICRLIKGRMKIHKLKLKMGSNYDQNREAVEAIRQVFEDDYDLKTDINGVWDREVAFKHLPLIEEAKINVVEEPMMPDDPGFRDFAAHLRGLGVKVMADEAACSLSDVRDIADKGHYNMINVRLSKCGGFRRSFKIVDFLRQKKIAFQVACHLGESGILSAAGRGFSLLCRDADYYDGCYDEYLLKDNTTVEHVSFEPGGAADPLAGPGLGVQINRQSLERLSNSAKKITLLKP
jgi:muconate cycloisomerase